MANDAITAIVIVVNRLAAYAGAHIQVLVKMYTHCRYSKSNGSDSSHAKSEWLLNKRGENIKAHNNGRLDDQALYSHFNTNGIKRASDEKASVCFNAYFMLCASICAFI